MQYFKNVNIFQKSSEGIVWNSVSDFFFLVDNIQTHFDKALMSEIVFLYMHFSYSSYFHGFKEQLQFHMKYYFKYNAALCRPVGNIEMKALVC